MQLRSPRKFNPQLMSKEELNATFVGREALLEDILKQVKDQTRSLSVQHYILIAPRGMGKTNLMQMLKHRIRDDSQMNKDWLPIVFAEEEFEIYGVRSFFEKILALIFEAASLEEHRDEFNENKLLDDEKLAIGKHIDMIQTLSESLKKQFIVFADNLDCLLMEQMPGDLAVKKLRTFLTTNNSVLLFGGAVKVFDEIISYNKPLFSHFAPIELAPLKNTEIEAFIKKRAEYENNKDILNNFDQYRPKIKAVSDLTGGNPRLILTLFDILSEKSFIDAASILTGILDDLTAYYQDILKSLPPKERKVLDTLLRSEIKLTSTNLSSKLRWTQSEISSLLKRLKDRQILRGKKASKGREVYYETTDSVFRIFYQMRYLSKQRKRLGFIIEFLQKWYSREDLLGKLHEHKLLYEKHLADASPEKVTEELEKAFYIADASVRYGVTDTCLELISTCIKSMDLDKALEELEEWKKNSDKTEINRCTYLGYKATVYIKKQDYIKVIECNEKLVKIQPDMHGAWYNMGISLLVLNDFSQSISNFKQYLELCMEKKLPFEDRNNGFLLSYHNQLHKSFAGKEKSKYFSFYKETLQIMKSFKGFDLFQIFGSLFMLLLEDSEFSFFKDCYEEIKAASGEGIYNEMLPFKTAAHYLETKDISILERLNHEERKPVDLILEEIEKQK